jgi:preprotein translocase subunit SecD
LYERAEVTGQAIEDAFVANDPQTNKPYVAVNFNHEGADQFRQLTGRNVKRRMAIVLDDKVESAPVIQTEIGGGRCQITLGGFRPYNQVLNAARDLVIVLKAGALPVPIRPANEQMIGPTLGRDGIEQGIKGGLLGIALVLVFMLFYYEVAGLVANLMVLLNLLLLLAGLAFFEATLTLPGLAAIALNVGMADHANVLIAERIREELRNGKSNRAAVDQGFARALWSIVDSQLTTLLAAVVLLQYGTGPIKGFAVSLMIGILTSLFTGVFGSRVLFDWLVRGLRVQRLRVG